MRTRILFAGTLLVLLGSCAAPFYMPSTKTIDINQYGSKISVDYQKVTERTRYSKDSIPYTEKDYNNYNATGELIAIDSGKIIVLEGSNECIEIPMTEVQKFRLQYARGKPYGWSIPVLGAGALSGGYFAVFVFPVSIIVTTSVTVGGVRSFTYSHKNITFTRLKMFARFPGGVPAGVSLSDIKYVETTPVAR